MRELFGSGDSGESALLLTTLSLCADEPREAEGGGPTDEEDTDTGTPSAKEGLQCAGKRGGGNGATPAPRPTALPPLMDRSDDSVGADGLVCSLHAPGVVLGELAPLLMPSPCTKLPVNASAEPVPSLLVSAADDAEDDTTTSVTITAGEDDDSNDDDGPATTSALDA